MTREVALNALKAGISRQRTKGGANPSTLYDLVNGYVTEAGTVQSRDGTVIETILPEGTVGLCAFNGELTVFSTYAMEMEPGYNCEIVIHPNDQEANLKEIHYAGPFLGYLYISAEFENGDCYHYWLQRRSAWKAETSYALGDVIEPTTRNGFAYRAHRLTDPGIVWAPDVARAVGDVVEPTVANGYQYTVTDTIGANPKSGTVEPDWPAEDGARIDENTDLSSGGGSTGGDNTPPNNPPPNVTKRYGNPGGNRPPGGLYTVVR